MTGRIHNDPDSFHTFFPSTSYCQKHNGSTGRHAQPLLLLTTGYVTRKEMQVQVVQIQVHRHYT